MASLTGSMRTLKTTDHGIRHRCAGSKSVLSTKHILPSSPNTTDVRGALVTTHCLKCAVQQLFMLPQLQPGSLQVRLCRACSMSGQTMWPKVHAATSLHAQPVHAGQTCMQSCQNSWSLTLLRIRYREHAYVLLRMLLQSMYRDTVGTVP
jgi:hypothetical protein